MREQLYPKQHRPPTMETHRWRVDFDLAYDGGGGAWSGYYLTRWGAKLSAWWHVRFASWGGSAFLVDRRHE